MCLCFFFFIIRRPDAEGLLVYFVLNEPERSASPIPASLFPFSSSFSRRNSTIRGCTTRRRRRATISSYQTKRPCALHESFELSTRLFPQLCFHSSRRDTPRLLRISPFDFEENQRESFQRNSISRGVSFDNVRQRYQRRVINDVVARDRSKFA